MSLKKSILSLLVGGLMSSAAGVALAQDAPKVLRMVPQSDLKILDPIWTTAFVTRNHGYNVYDTLFGVDINGTGYAPIEVTLPAEGRRDGEVVSVRLEASVSPIGTLALEAVPLSPRSTDERWKVELSVRGPVPSG